MKPSIQTVFGWLNWRPSGAISIALASLFVLTGCENWLPFGSRPSTIQEPPFIPAVAQPAANQTPEALPALSIGAYSDLPELGNTQLHSPLLVQAVSHAISLGVLKPSSPEEAFQPNAPIQYGEFQQWANTYQNAASQALPSMAAPSPTVPTKTRASNAEVSHEPESLQNPFNAEKIHLLNGSIPWPPGKISASEPISREALCAFYGILAQKTDQAQALKPNDIEQTTPSLAPEDGASASQYPLGEFKDFSAISNWAKPYVALAYQDGLLQKITGLTGEQLTVDFGFQPKAPATREQAILMLNSLYGHLKAPETLETPALQSPGLPSEKQNSTVLPQSATTTKQSARPTIRSAIQNPPIIQHQSMVRETGPGLQRKATHLSTPQ